MVSRRLISIQSTARVLIIAIIVAYCVPNTVAAQSANPPSQNSQNSTTTNQPQVNPSAAQPVAPSQPAPSDNAGQGNDNASQPEQKPVTTYPDAAGVAQQNAPASPDAPQPKTQNGQTQSEPQGAATAEKVSTAGGAAAKPAGVAIAPAKQHQTRSLMIKIGAFLAAGAAAGTVYALSRGTSSTPPGATSPGVVQKK